MFSEIGHFSSENGNFGIFQELLASSGMNNWLIFG